MNMKMNLMAVALILCALVASVTFITYAAIVTSVDKPTKGTIKASAGLDLTYVNGTEISTIDWGALSNGTSTTLNVVVKNTGNQNLTLSMTTANMSPIGVVSLSWNKENTVLAAGASVTAILTLTIPSNGLATDFTFDTIVNGNA